MKISGIIEQLQKALEHDGDLEAYTVQVDNAGYPYFEQAEAEVHEREQKDVGSPYAKGHSRRNPEPLPEKFIVVV